MALYTSSYLKSVYQNNRAVVESDIRTRNFSSSTISTFDIFLSHSFLDREDVLGLYYDLKRKGYTVYVDWIVDPHLDRNNVTKESATLIRNRMKSSKSLLLAVSYNAAMSKWMPWELGFVDGTTAKCAISPVSTDNTLKNNFKGLEYLSLYPYIERKGTPGFEILYISEATDIYVTFSQWLKNNAKPTTQRTF